METVFKKNDYFFQKIKKKEKSIFQISEKNAHFFGKRFSFYFLKLNFNLTKFLKCSIWPKNAVFMKKSKKQ